MLCQFLLIKKLTHDYLIETKDRFDFYKKKEERLLDLEFLTRSQEVIFLVRL